MRELSSAWQAVLSFEKTQDSAVSVMAGCVIFCVLFCPSVWVAWKVNFLRGRKKEIICRVFTILSYFPPALTGTLLLLWRKEEGITGKALLIALGYHGSFPDLGCVLASLLVCFGVVVHISLSGFKFVKQEDIYAARTLGIRRSRAFFKIVLPQVKKKVLKSALFGLSRSIGEYGATAILLMGIKAGIQEGENTIFGVELSYYLAAWIWSFIFLLIFGVLLCFFDLIGFCQKKIRGKL